jgi:23S rRNA pseudouridine1911/1915/1917 synthase
MDKLFQVVFEDLELLVINKPAGLVCHPTKTDQYSSLIGRIRLYLGDQSHPQLVNRLDRETSGVTVVAKTASAARQLRRLWESRSVEKDYLAIVHGHVQEDSGRIDAPLGKDSASRVAIKDCVRQDGAVAITEYRVETRFVRPGEPPTNPQKHPIAPRPFSLLRLNPHTGRKHQIRIHLAHIGHPIVGDKLYGGDEDLYLALVEDRLTPEQRARLILPYHALHASCVRILWQGQGRSFCAQPEPWFVKFLTERAP